MSLNISDRRGNFSFSTVLFISGWNASESCSVMSDSLRSHELYSPWNSPGQNTGVGSRSLLQGIFPTQGLDPGLPHFRRILYQLSHQESPRILEWVAYPFSSGSSWPRNQTRDSILHCRWILYQLSYQELSHTMGKNCAICKRCGWT